MKYLFFTSLFNLFLIVSSIGQNCDDCRIDLYINSNAKIGKTLIQKLNNEPPNDEGNILVEVRDFGKANLSITDLNKNKLVIRFWIKKKNEQNRIFGLLKGAAVLSIHRYKGKKQLGENFATINQRNFEVKKISKQGKPQIPEAFLFQEEEPTVKSPQYQPSTSDCDICGDDTVPYKEEMITEEKVKALITIINNLINHKYNSCSNLEYCEDFFKKRLNELNRTIKKIDNPTRTKIGYFTLTNLKKQYFGNNTRPSNNTRRNQNTRTHNNNNGRNSSATQTAIYKLNGDLNKLLPEMDSFIADLVNKTDSQKELLTDKAILQKEEIENFFSGGSNREQKIEGYQELLDKIKILGGYTPSPKSETPAHNTISTSELTALKNNITALTEKCQRLIEEKKKSTIETFNHAEYDNVTNNFRKIRVSAEKLDSDVQQKIGYNNLNIKITALDEVPYNSNSSSEKFTSSSVATTPPPAIDLRQEKLSQLKIKIDDLGNRIAGLKRDLNDWESRSKNIKLDYRFIKQQYNTINIHGLTQNELNQIGYSNINSKKQELQALYQQKMQATAMSSSEMLKELSRDAPKIKVGNETLEFLRVYNSDGTLHIGITNQEYMKLLGNAGGSAATYDNEKISQNVSRVIPMRKSYFIGKYEVSNKEFKAVIPDYIYSPVDADKPVTNISYEDIKEFCTRVGQKIPKSLGFEVDIPTEVEWEYAAKGNVKNKRYIWGGDKFIPEKAQIKAQGLINRNVIKEESWCGAVGLIGNAAEICSITDKYYLNKSRGEKCVAKGGSYLSKELDARITARHLLYNVKDNQFGFRLVIRQK